MSGGQKIALPACAGFISKIPSAHPGSFLPNYFKLVNIKELPTQANRQEREEERWNLFACAGCYLK